MNLMKKANSGQVVVITLLIGLVVLTIGLGVASRAITDIKLSREEQESSRAFNIAEAGIEELLKEPILKAGPPISKTIGKITREINVYEEPYFEATVDVNETVAIKLDFDYVGSIDISWVKKDEGENPGGCSEGAGNAPASIEVMTYREEGGVYSVTRAGFNSCDGLEDKNKFVTAGLGGDFLAKQTINVDNNDKVVRIRVLYKKATVRVEGSGSLGALMYKITSRAQAEVGETRQVEVERTRPALPSIFDYALFSGRAIE